MLWCILIVSSWPPPPPAIVLNLSRPKGLQSPSSAWRTGKSQQWQYQENGRVGNQTGVLFGKKICKCCVLTLHMTLQYCEGSDGSDDWVYSYWRWQGGFKSKSSQVAFSSIYFYLPTSRLLFSPTHMFTLAILKWTLAALQLTIAVLSSSPIVTEVNLDINGWWLVCLFHPVSTGRFFLRSNFPIFARRKTRDDPESSFLQFIVHGCECTKSTTQKHDPEILTESWFCFMGILNWI